MPVATTEKVAVAGNTTLCAAGCVVMVGAAEGDGAGLGEGTGAGDGAGVGEGDGAGELPLPSPPHAVTKTAANSAVRPARLRLETSPPDSALLFLVVFNPVLLPVYEVRSASAAGRTSPPKRESGLPK